MKKKLPFPFPLSESEILRKRASILTALCCADESFCQIPVRGIRSETLSQMLKLYDASFFDHVLERSYKQLRITLSGRLTSSAGKFIYTRRPLLFQRDAEIRMSGDFLTRLDKGPFNLNGLSVSTPQEAFLVVFEHELCHALEAALYGQTGHSSRFRALAKGLFGHTATRHSLPTRRQDAAKDGLFVGRRASFSYQGATLCGTITYIGKTATVMVPARLGAYTDRLGKRYDKYRVSPDELSPID